VRVCAVGEIGLDAVGERRASLARQERLFRAQLALARRQGLPVALHVLGAGAHVAALAVIADVGAPSGGVLHSCSASAELVREYLAHQLGRRTAPARTSRRFSSRWSTRWRVCAARTPPRSPPIPRSTHAACSG
jgi:TatD DNase family protein